MKPSLLPLIASLSVLVSATVSAADRTVTLTRFTDADPKREVTVAADEQAYLESSVDMVTWTAATPGTYAASTAQRFFRVRAIQQPGP